MKTHIEHKLRHTPLAPSKALMPLFEAVVNSVQAIHLLPDRSDTYVHIEVRRDRALELEENLDREARINGLSITDNGIGFMDRQAKAFYCANTPDKIELGGKGEGRFLWLKVFGYAEITSNYHENGQWQKRSFQFSPSTDDDEPPLSEPSSSNERRTVIGLHDMREPYKHRFPVELEKVAHAIVEHCLMYFQRPDCPQIVVSEAAIPDSKIDLRAYYKDHFHAEASNHPFMVGVESFSLTGLRVYHPRFTSHKLIYTADFREVDHTDLCKEIGLPNKLNDTADKPFVYLGVVAGEFLDKNTNNERTAFNFPKVATEESEDSGLFGGITQEAIKTEAISRVTEELAPFLTEINKARKEQATEFIRRNPQYRPLLPELDSMLDRLPIAGQESVWDSRMHTLRYEKERELKQQQKELIEQGKRQILTPDDYEKRVSDIVERSGRYGKSALVEHVAHRKAILDFLNETLKQDPETGQYSLEHMVHRIIYPMGIESSEVDYDKQNLWIIDERLAFHELLASDKPLNRMSFLDNDSALRPDLCVIFERALSFAEGDDSPPHSLVVVEFKRPERTDYKASESPIQQVLDLVEKIQSGRHKDIHGRTIPKANKLPAYAYVVCSITPQIERFAKPILERTPDGLGFFGYVKNYDTYVEIISYAKLVTDAEKRNAILFHKLGMSDPGG